MNRTFVDTSFFVAFLSPGDELHREASLLFTKNSASWVTTAWVLIELGNYVSRERERPLFKPFIEQLQQDRRVHIIDAEMELFYAGLDLYADRADKTWSFVDCISFIVMKRWGIRNALSADRHFAQAGFNVLLA